MTRLLAVLLVAGCAAKDPAPCTSLKCLKAKAQGAQRQAGLEAICQHALQRSACTRSMSCEVRVQLRGEVLVCRW